MDLHQIIVISLLSGVATAYLADRRGGLPLVWFLLGIFFGPLAFAVALTAGKRCKYCYSWIPKDATHCRECTKEQ